MLEEFSKRAIDIINRLKELSSYKKLGSEYLLKAMYEIDDSLCHFLFTEYNVKAEEIDEELNDIEIIRYDDSIYTKELTNIFNTAKKMADKDKVSDEHIFMAILYTKDSIAYQMLERLGFDIKDLINDVNEIYDFNSNEIDMPYLYNMTSNIKGTYIGIDDYIDRIMVILKRKNKNNPILIGNAGVGKTAIVEGLSKYIVENNIDMEIVSLNVGGMISGTKYRGDFEERLTKTIKEIIKRKNIVLFIDEIHTIVGSGSGESSLDISNMLKPYLARNDFKVIGATTLSEYNKYILPDKALQRRFETVFVSEPTLEETKRILYGIKKDYEDYHKVVVPNKVLDYLIDATDSRINNKKRPDKCIDILDSMMSYLELHNIKKATINDVNNAINKTIGYKEGKDDIYYKCLYKYQFMYINNLVDKCILKLKYDGNDDGYNILLNDLKKLFGIKEENVLELNLANYKESFMITSLIGAPPGYIGYDDDGVLSKHIKSYPISVISISNVSSGAPNIVVLLDDLYTKGFFYNKRGEYISSKNTILIYKDIASGHKIGFNSRVVDDFSFDESISYYKKKANLNIKYLDILKRYNVEASILFDIDDTNKMEVNDTIYNIVKNKTKGKITIFKENNRIKYS